MTLISACAVLPACASSDGDTGDAEDGEHDLATGKADSIAEGSADAKKILELANDVRMHGESFDEQVGLSSRVARAIADHRYGEDGEDGTDDDNPFDSLAELDAVPYLGPVAMRTMLTYARSHVVSTKLRIELVAQEYDEQAEQHRMIKLASLNPALASANIAFDTHMVLGARDGIKFLRMLEQLEKANAKLGRELDFDFTWSPSEYTGLCYDGDVKQVDEAVDGLRYSLFSIYMGIQAERVGTRKTVNYGGASEREWMESQVDAGNESELEVWKTFDTGSSDYLMMVDGGQQGDGTELDAVLIKRCE